MYGFSHIAMFGRIRTSGEIIGVSGIDYVSNPYILAHKDSNMIWDPKMNYELLGSKRCCPVIRYREMVNRRNTMQLKELFILMYVVEY